MLVWSDPDGVNWQRFDDSGAAFDPAPHRFVIRERPVETPALSVAASKDAFLIAWDEVYDADTSSVRAFIAPAHGEGDAAPMIVTARGRTPVVASDGFSFLVAFSRVEVNSSFRSNAVFDVIVGDDQRVYGENTLMNPGGYVSVGSIEALWTGNRYLIAWNDYTFNITRSLSARFVATNGAPLGAAAFTIVSGGRLTTYPALFSIASSGNDFLVVHAVIESTQIVTGVSECAVIADDGSIRSVVTIPRGFDYALFDDHEYVVATAPGVALTWPFVAIADRGSIHVASTVRRRAAAAR